jgi:segregation and condensation protein A
MNDRVTTDAFGKNVYRYQVRLPGFDFEGPLDLLLQLIERKELPITEISLASIAEEYAAYTAQLSEINPGELSEFLVISARLLLIKSAALLPAPPARPGEPVDSSEEARELLEQLREYRRIKEAARFLNKRQEDGWRAYPGQRTGLNEVQLAQLNQTLQRLFPHRHSGGLHELKLSDMLALVKRRLALQRQEQLKLPLPIDRKELGRSIKIEDRIALMEQKLVGDGRIEFSSLFEDGESNERLELQIIVTFMALLELLRRRAVTARQDELFGEIIIEKV